MAVRFYSAREITQVTQFTLEQLKYLQEIELAMPRWPSRGQGGDRYDDLNLLRLQLIRVGRSRGLALEEIRRWLDAGASPPSLESLRPGAGAIPPVSRPQRSLFLQTEVKVETDAGRRTFYADAAHVYGSLARWRASGVLPSDAAVAPWAERHRFHIDRWFCPCAPRDHLAFGRAIAANSYLAAIIERHGVELTSFMLGVLSAVSRKGAASRAPAAAHEPLDADGPSDPPP